VLINKSIDHRVTPDPVVLPDIAAADTLQYPQEALKEGIKGIVSLPITLSGKLVGVLRLYHYERWEVSARDLDSLTILADTIGLAMMYTRLVNALRAMKEVIGEIHPVWL
jgi:GAF domain-containing protein